MRRAGTAACGCGAVVLGSGMPAFPENLLTVLLACVFARLAIGHGGENPGAALGAIATGVGFLGAGVILRRGLTVRGLSTAATFWAVAAVGAATGLFEFGMA